MRPPLTDLVPPPAVSGRPEPVDTPPAGPRRWECLHCGAHTFPTAGDQAKACHVCGSHKLVPLGP
ncbi:MAG: hypothetical protein JOZ07_13280 [Solirubrobacterales bacterium]|nr:hypothetical protein [Solirubrobacterales bacterium]